MGRRRSVLVVGCWVVASLLWVSFAVGCGSGFLRGTTEYQFQTSGRESVE